MSFDENEATQGIVHNEEPSRRDVLKLGTGLAAGLLLHQLDANRLMTRWQQTDPKRIYIAADDHTDYLWSGTEEDYRRAFVQMLDYYLDLADTTANEPSDFQSRWNCDGSFWLWTYEHEKTPAEFERLIERIRDGHISAPITPLVILWGGAPAEAVLRGMYYAGKLERRYSLRFRMAVSMENQTLPYGLGMLWAGAGAQYSWKGICNCFTRVVNPNDREHEIYWWAGPDGSKVLVKWYSQFFDENWGGSQYIGTYLETRNPRNIVEYLDGADSFSSRYPYRVIGAFGYGGDDLETYTDEFVAVAKEKTNAQRRVIVSNEEDFFADFEATYGTQIPSICASFGNEWDLYCVSMAEVSAKVKRYVEKLRATESMATLVQLQDSTFMSGRQETRDLAWMSIGLYWEHDWTANGPVPRDTRAQWQRTLVTNIAAYIDDLHEDARQALGGMIEKQGTNSRFYAFNPLSWTRTDMADYPYSAAGPVHVIDLSTGQETPSQLITQDGQQYIRVLARDLPAVGYKVFEIRAGAGTDFGSAATIATNVIENARYRLVVDGRGAITSLVDKSQGDREFVQVIDGRAVNDLGTGSGTVTVENAGAVSATLVATATGPLSHTSRITLIRDLDRIDIRNEITQNFSDVFTWDFSFNLTSPDVWHEEVGAVIRAKLLADGGHYSPRNARYDWLTLNHFADMSGADGAGVTLANADCYYMNLGHSAANTLDTATPRISVLVGGQVDGPDLGIPNQHGDSYFLQRFALRAHTGYHTVSAMRFALEHQNPLVTGAVSGTNPVYPETSYSLLSISDPDVLLWALKPADDEPDQGCIARLWNLTATPKNLDVQFSNQAVIEAQQTTHIETPIGSAAINNGALSASLNAYQLKTYRVKLGDPAGSLPTAPTNLTVSGDLNLSPVRPTFRWTHPSASAFRLKLTSGETTLLDQWYDAAIICSAAGCGVTLDAQAFPDGLPNGSYTWQVQARDSTGAVSLWSTPASFTVTVPTVNPDFPPPTQLTIGGDLATAPVRPTFSWVHQLSAQDTTVPGDTYHLVIFQGAAVILDRWYDAAAISSGIACTVALDETTFPDGLLNGAYTWKVQAKSDTRGISDWSVSVSFVVRVPAPQAPKGIIVDPNLGHPRISWDDDPHALWFQVYIGTTNFVQMFLGWVRRSAELCTDNRCGFSPDVYLPNGQYEVYIRSWGPGGYCNDDLHCWTGPTTFRVNYTAPGAASNLATTAEITGRPAFMWTGTTGATWYHLWIGTARSFEQRHLQWYPASAMNCFGTAGQCAITPEIDLSNGDYVWYVRAWGPGGYSEGGVQGWAGPGEFTVRAALPPKASLIAPTGQTAASPLAFHWEPVRDATWFEIWVGTYPDYQTVHHQWYHFTELGSDMQGNSIVTLSNVQLADGHHAWYLRSYSPAGLGPWSDEMRFTYTQSSA